MFTFSEGVERNRSKALRIAINSNSDRVGNGGHRKPGLIRRLEFFEGETVSM